MRLPGEGRLVFRCGLGSGYNRRCSGEPGKNRESLDDRCPLARDHAVRDRGEGRSAQGAGRGAALLRARRRQSPLRPDRRPGGNPRDRLHRPRPGLGHLQPGDRGPQDRSARRRLRGHLPGDLQGREPGAALPGAHPGCCRRHAPLRSDRHRDHRLRHQPDRLRGPAPDRGRGRPAGRGPAHRRSHRALDLSGADRPHVPVPGRPGADPRGAARRAGHLHDGGRCLRDGGSPELERCLLQDLRAAARQALALYAQGRREHRTVGRPDRQRRGPESRGRGRSDAARARARRGRRDRAGARSQPPAGARRGDARGRGSDQEARAPVPGLPVRLPDCRRLRGAPRARALDLPVRPADLRSQQDPGHVQGDRRGDRG